MNIEIVISALNRQIKLEKAKLEKRNMMIANASQVLYNEPLPDANKLYIAQLQSAIHLLILGNEAVDCLIECQKHHQGGHSEIGFKIKEVIENYKVND